MLLLVTYLLILFLCWFWLYQYIVNSLKYALFYLLILYHTLLQPDDTMITSKGCWHFNLTLVFKEQMFLLCLYYLIKTTLDYHSQLFDITFNSRRHIRYEFCKVLKTLTMLTVFGNINIKHPILNLCARQFNFFPIFVFNLRLNCSK